MGARKRNSSEKIKEARKTQAIAKLNNCPTSPRKMRLVADLVRGEDATSANLVVKSINVDSARMLKRIQAAPQGRAHRIRKRSNHVTLIIDKA
jgi:large subunit ribosomal protein L22